MRVSDVVLALLAVLQSCVAGAQALPPVAGGASAIHLPSAAELARQPAPVLPRIDTPAMPLQRGIDAGALAAQYEAMGRAARPADERPVSGLLVFVTLQMPRPSLQRLVEQAERARATLVLRGLKNRSMKDTLAEVAGLIGQRKVAWMIHPESFKRYGVGLAPTFVLVAAQGAAVAGCAAGQCGAEPSYSSVSGDVSTAYALQRIEQGDPAFKPQVLVYRRRLEARP